MLVRNIKVIDDLLQHGFIITDNPYAIQDSVAKNMASDSADGLFSVLRDLEKRPDVEVRKAAFDHVRRVYANS